MKDFRKNLKKVTNLPKILPDSDIKKLKNSQGNKIEEGMRKMKEAKNEDEISL